jgi:RNA polymerase sigma-70 factor (ECF subfamily)
MRDGAEAGLAHIDAVLEPSSGKQGELANYYLAHSARADMYRRLGRTSEARASYEKALAPIGTRAAFSRDAARGIEIKLEELK